MRSPEKYHQDEHRGPFADCRRCRRQAGHCRQKIRFTDWLEAQEWVTEYHESHEYAKPWQYRYRSINVFEMAPAGTTHTKPAEES